MMSRSCVSLRKFSNRASTPRSTGPDRTCRRLPVGEHVAHVAMAHHVANVIAADGLSRSRCRSRPDGVVEQVVLPRAAEQQDRPALVLPEIHAYASSAYHVPPAGRLRAGAPVVAARQPGQRALPVSTSAHPGSGPPHESAWPPSAAASSRIGEPGPRRACRPLACVMSRTALIEGAGARQTDGRRFSHPQAVSYGSQDETTDRSRHETACFLQRLQKDKALTGRFTRHGLHFGHQNRPIPQPGGLEGWRGGVRGWSGSSRVR
jgi:hypothetical protein